MIGIEIGSMRKDGTPAQADLSLRDFFVDRAQHDDCGAMARELTPAKRWGNSS